MGDESSVYLHLITFHARAIALSGLHDLRRHPLAVGWGERVCIMARMAAGRVSGGYTTSTTAEQQRDPRSAMPTERRRLACEVVLRPTLAGGLGMRGGVRQQS